MTQNDEILAALRRGDRLTHRDALDRWGCSRLAARVWELERAGHAIHSRMVTAPGRDGTVCLVAEYSMEPPGVLFATPKPFVWEDA